MIDDTDSRRKEYSIEMSKYKSDGNEEEKPGREGLPYFITVCRPLKFYIVAWPQTFLGSNHTNSNAITLKDSLFRSRIEASLCKCATEKMIECPEEKIHRLRMKQYDKTATNPCCVQS